MKYLKYLVIGLFSALTLQGCGGSSKDDPDIPIPTGETVDVSFVTEVMTKSVTTELNDEQTMNVFAKEYNTLSSNDMQTNIKATRKGGTWIPAPAIKLTKAQKAFLYAVHPYDAANVDPTAVPVQVQSQIDYLYSGAGVAVTFNTHTGKLTMKHALSMLSFNISLNGYEGKGELQEVTVNGEEYFTTGTLNIETGQIKGTTAGTYKKATSQTITKEGWTEKLPEFFCIPFASKGSNVAVTMKVDGKNYAVFIPEMKIEQGMKYIFRLALSSHGLTLFADQTEKISLNVYTDEMPDMGAYSVLKLKHTKNSFTIPTIEGGEGFRGNIYWGNGEIVGYTPNASYTYKGGGNKEVTVETWNATKVSLPTLEGIEEIDLSEF